MTSIQQCAIWRCRCVITVCLCASACVSHVGGSSQNAGYRRAVLVGMAAATSGWTFPSTGHQGKRAEREPRSDGALRLRTGSTWFSGPAVSRAAAGKPHASSGNQAGSCGRAATSGSTAAAGDPKKCIGRRVATWGAAATSSSAWSFRPVAESRARARTAEHHTTAGNETPTGGRAATAVAIERISGVAVTARTSSKAPTATTATAAVTAMRRRTVDDLEALVESKSGGGSTQVLLDLFCGTGGVGRAAEANGCPSISLDLMNGFDLTEDAMVSRLEHYISAGRVSLG